MAVALLIGGLAAAAGLASSIGGGFGLTYIQETKTFEQMLLGNVKKVTRVIETNKVARIFAGIFSFGLSELLNHKQVHEEYFFEDEYIGSNEESAAEELYKRGDEFYKKGDYKTAANLFERASGLTVDRGKIHEKYKGSLKRVRRRIEEEALRRELEKEAEKIRRETSEKEAREEALRIARAKAQAQSLLKEAISIYQQAEAMSSLELKLDNYEKALYKCEESCASGATEEAFNTLNKIFESCVKHDAHDEAEDAVRIVREYFPSEAGRLEHLVNQRNISWSPDYERRACRQLEQNMILLQ